MVRSPVSRRVGIANRSEIGRGDRCRIFQKRDSVSHETDDKHTEDLKKSDDNNMTMAEGHHIGALSNWGSITA
jgi:hypothetical protein